MRSARGKLILPAGRSLGRATTRRHHGPANESLLMGMQCIGPIKPATNGQDPENPEDDGNERMTIILYPKRKPRIYPTRPPVFEESGAETFIRCRCRTPTVGPVLAQGLLGRNRTSCVVRYPGRATERMEKWWDVPSGPLWRIVGTPVDVGRHQVNTYQVVEFGYPFTYVYTLSRAQSIF